MKPRSILALALIALLASTTLAAELVGVDGSSAQYATPIECKIGSKSVKLVLTGTALRKKFIFSVYAIGSYVHEGITVRGAEELAQKDCAKQLHLIMERDVAGDDMVEAFASAIRLNYDAGQFQNELAKLRQAMQGITIHRGDHIRLTHVPGTGLRCDLAGKSEITIASVPFSRAVWEIYLGPNNLGEGIKRGLVSRL